jgi:proline-rich tail region repeat protein
MVTLSSRELGGYMVRINYMRIGLIIGVICLILIIGCSGPQKSNEAIESVAPELPSASAEPSQIIIVEIPEEPTQEITTESSPLPVGTEKHPDITDGSPESTQIIQPTQPAVKSGLVATNPSLVQLSAGKPQLVEFFAFW